MQEQRVGVLELAGERRAFGQQTVQQFADFLLSGLGVERRIPRREGVKGDVILEEASDTLISEVPISGTERV